jgi:DNA polymerase elongation subunit (family B)
MDKPNKIYLVLGDSHQLYLETRYEVDSWLKEVEEGHGSINQTVIGSVDLDVKEPYFFFIFKLNKQTTVYDVISAKTQLDAMTKLALKKRYAGKTIEFKRIQNIENIIRDYKAGDPLP